MVGNVMPAASVRQWGSVTDEGGLIDARVHALERGDLRRIPADNVAVLRIVEREILVIRFGRVERAAFDGGDDRAVPQLGRAKLRDVGLRDRGLFGALGEQGGAVLGAAVGALAVLERG